MKGLINWYDVKTSSIQRKIMKNNYCNKEQKDKINNLSNWDEIELFIDETFYNILIREIDKRLTPLEELSEEKQNLYNDDIENEVKNRKINFPKLFNTNTQTRSPFDLSMIDEATKTHSKSITPFNTCNYTSMNNYEELPEMKGKMSAKNLNTMLTPKMSSVPT